MADLARLSAAGGLDLRDAELPAGARALWFPAGAIGLGMRIAVARPVRSPATTVVMATSAAVVLLLLGLATALQRLEHDPGTIGKNYQLTSHSGVLALPRIRRLPGVAARRPALLLAGG